MDMTTRWNKVADATVKAVSITWEGCHKIYIHMDEGRHDDAVEIGYDCLRLDDIGFDEAMKNLREWYDESCGLRFISTITTVPRGTNPNLGFDDLIPQFAEESDEEE